MKISFEDGSYVDLQKKESNKYILVISANDGKNVNKNIINTVELTQDQLQLLLKV